MGGLPHMVPHSAVCALHLIVVAQLGRAQLTFSVPFYCNNLELQEELELFTVQCLHQSGTLRSWLAIHRHCRFFTVPGDVVKFFRELVEHIFYHESDRQ